VALISGGRGLYRRMGCIDAGLYQAVTVDTASRVPDMRCEVREWTPADVPFLCALHRREPVRFVRDEQKTRAALSTGKVHARAGRTWVVLVNERVCAFIVASLPVRVEDGKRLAVREMAGSRAAILAAMPAVLRQAGLTEAELDAPASDNELRVLAEANGLRSRPMGFHGTVRIIDVAGTLAALKGWIDERADGARLVIEPGVQTRFSLDGESMTVSTEDLAALVFGSIERPAPAAPAGLAKVMERIFPVPLPCYGLSYT